MRTSTALADRLGSAASMPVAWQQVHSLAGSSESSEHCHDLPSHVPAAAARAGRRLPSTSQAGMPGPYSHPSMTEGQARGVVGYQAWDRGGPNASSDPCPFGGLQPPHPVQSHRRPQGGWQRPQALAAMQQCLGFECRGA